MKDDPKQQPLPANEGQEQSAGQEEEQNKLTDDGRESSNGKVTGVEGKDYVILSSGLGIDE